MKKSLIALAVAGVMTAPVIAQADATLYGKIEQRLKFTDSDSGDSDANLEADDIRIGVKGTVDMDAESVTGIYKFEYEVNPDSSTSTDTATGDTFTANSLSIRDAYIGAKGDFGTVMVGRFGNPAEAVYGYTGGFSEDTGNIDLSTDRLGAALGYVSPSFSGVSVYVAAVMEGQADAVNEEDVDVTLVGANYSMGDLNLSVAYWSADQKYVNGSVGDQDFTGVGGEYSFGPTKLGLSYQNMEFGDDSETEIVGVRVVQTLTDKVWVQANYHDIEDKTAAGAKTDSDQWSVAAIYKLGAKASLDAEYVANDQNNVDSDTLSFAYTLSF